MPSVETTDRTEISSLKARLQLAAHASRSIAKLGRDRAGSFVLTSRNSELELRTSQVTLEAMKDVTLILQRIEKGQAEASEDLFPAVYAELRRLAAGKMNAERMDHTLSATALVHEAYVRLVDTETVQEWNGRGHFFSAAAEAMRRILVEHARAKLRQKRGGEYQRHNGVTELGELPTDPAVLIDFNESLERLEVADAESAELVKLILFTGQSVAEAGRTLGMSRKVAYSHWEYVRRWFAIHT